MINNTIPTYNTTSIPLHYNQSITNIINIVITCEQFKYML